MTIHHSDCIRGMNELVEPGSIDVIVTSPPYNIGIEYGVHDDAAPRRDYLAWTRRWTAAAEKVLSRRGSFFLNLAGKPSDPWGPFEVLMELRGTFVLQNTIHWIKSIAINPRPGGPRGAGAGTVGHYKPINSPRYVNDCHEYIFHLTKHGDVPLDRLAVGVPYADESNARRWTAGSGGARCRGNTWLVPYETIQRRTRDRPHPASFPPAVPRMCMLLHGVDRIRRVLDPFLGIGSSALAAHGLELPFTGFETDPGYLETARRRLRNAEGPSRKAHPHAGTPGILQGARPPESREQRTSDDDGG